MVLAPPARSLGSLEVSLDVSAVIFDLDGVLIDSRAVVERAWVEWGKGRGLDPEFVQRVIPGKRTRDAVALLAPDSDIDAEAAWIVAREASLVDHCVPIPGARALVDGLPAGRWGIATSGTEAIARSRLKQGGFSAPDVFITAEMVVLGKPDPEVYVRAAGALGVDPASCVVFEDAPSGVAAATIAGSLVIGVLTWAEPGLLRSAYSIPDLRAVRAAPLGEQIRLTLEQGG